MKLPLPFQVTKEIATKERPTPLQLIKTVQQSN